MYDMSLLEDRICDELRKIAEKGITTGNIDNAYKLIDMYKDIKQAASYGGESGYYSTAHHDDMSKSYDKYMDSKASYRYSGASDCKSRMMDTLEEYMDSFVEKMENMLNDTDCQEERDTIHRYISKIKSLR